MRTAILAAAAPLIVLVQDFTVNIPVRDILLVRSYFIGLAMLFAMIYLKYRVGRPFKTIVYLSLGFVAFVFFLLGTSTAIYAYPYSGIIVSTGYSLTILVIGIAIGHVLDGPEYLTKDCDGDGDSS